MVLVMVLTPLFTLAAIAAVVLLLPGRYLGVAAIPVIISVCLTFTIARRRTRQPRGRRLTENDDPELVAVVDRLCAMADIARPELWLSTQSQPNSWVVHVPRRTPRLYVTTGLRALLTIDELTAVLGHELAHIANRDAVVMTMAGGPGRLMLNVRGGGIDGALFAAIGVVSQVLTTILSRYRELAADAGSAALTGRPSALATALVKVSGSLEAMPPTTDLRAAAALNAFNLVAVPRKRRRAHRYRLLGHLLETHPPLQARLDALSALERVQHSR